MESKDSKQTNKKQVKTVKNCDKCYNEKLSKVIGRDKEIRKCFLSQSFIPSFIQQILIDHLVEPGPVLGSRDTTMNKADKFYALIEFILY